MDKTFLPSYFPSQITYLCGSGNGRIFALPLPQEKDRFHIPDIYTLYVYLLSLVANVFNCLTAQLLFHYAAYTLEG